MPFINLAIGWLFGTGFLIGAVVSLFYYPLLAVPCVLLSAFILPVVSSKVHGKTGWTLDWKLRRVILVFLVGSCLVLINTAIKEKERAKKAAALRTQVAFFAANKQSILDTIRTAIDNGEFEAAITHAERYLIVNNADLEKIKKIAESRLEEQRKRQHEEAILARLKKIPVKEYQKNKNFCL